MEENKKIKIDPEKILFASGKAEGVELTDEELGQVSGGFYTSGYVYSSPEKVLWQWGIGARVELITDDLGILGMYTTECTVLDYQIYPVENGYKPIYYVYVKSKKTNEWHFEQEFQGGYTDISVF